MNPTSIFEKISITHLLIVNVITIVLFAGVFGTVIYPKSGDDKLDIIASATKLINKDSDSSSSKSKDKSNGDHSAPEATPQPKPNPIAIAIPSIELQAPVIKVSFVKETNEIEVPKDAGDVGWYKYSPLPGVNGSTVMSGHYDTPTGAPAVFYNLADVKAGDTFQITNALAKELEYKVIAVRNLPLMGFPKDLIFGDRDYSQVTLMTCAGVFNPATKLYSHRLAVIGQYVGEKDVELLADAGDGIGQYVVEGFTEQENDRDFSMQGVYLRMEADQEKISLYLASNGEDIIAAETVFQFDPTQISFDPDLVAFHNGFESYYAHQPSDNTFSVSVFTDPARSNIQPFNTGAMEVKVADIFFTREAHDYAQTDITPVLDTTSTNTSKVLKYQEGVEIHSMPNILNVVKGTQVQL